MPFSVEELVARRAARKLANLKIKEQARINLEKNQKPVRSIVISIEWKKSRVWSANPHASADVRYQDGTCTQRDGYTCSGCGYDKESTVIAEIFNDFLRYKLWEKKPALLETGAPYGIRRGKEYTSPEGNYYHGETRSYSGGVGTSCYNQIAAFIGGVFRQVACGKTFDVYEYQDIEGTKV
jgi:hypothetical protein